MTWTATQARDRNRASIVLLVEIQTLASGPLLKFADRNVTISGVQYADYIAGISGLGDTLSRATGSFANQPISVVFKNEPFDDGSTAYAYLSALSEDHPLEGAAVTVKECFLDDDGTPATPETLFVGNLDSPTGITGIAFTCACMTREAFASQQNR